MFTNRFINILIGMSFAALALWTASFNSLPKNNETYQDYAQRHRGEVIIPVTGLKDDSQTSDYYQRHRNEFVALRTLDTTEYFLRRPELSEPAAKGIDLTDYFFRHPALLPALKTIDLTD